MYPAHDKTPHFNLSRIMTGVPIPHEEIPPAESGSGNDRKVKIRCNTLYRLYGFLLSHIELPGIYRFDHGPFYLYDNGPRHGPIRDPSASRFNSGSYQQSLGLLRVIRRSEIKRFSQLDGEITLGH